MYLSVENSSCRTGFARMSEREGGKLREFYFHSGVRENSSCVTKPKYRMSPLDTGETRERYCLRACCK